MRITSNLFQTNSLFLKGSYSSIKRVNVQSTDASARRDRNTVSPQGRTMNMIQQLTDQKKAISQRKHDLIGRTLEDGGDMKNIEAQLDAFDEQMTQMDQQISQLTTSLAEQLSEKMEKKVKQSQENAGEDEGKTEEQRETERLTNLATATDKIGHAEGIAAISNKVESTANVLEGEIGLSDVQADTYESMEKIAQGKAVANDENVSGRRSLTGMEKVIARIRSDMVETGVEVSQLRQLAQNMELDQMDQVREAQEQADAAKKDPTAEAAPTEEEAAIRPEEAAAETAEEAPQTPSDEA